MTRDMTIVGWADHKGTGFSRYEPHGQSASPAFWTAADRLRTSDLSQPPEQLRETVPHPIWTLRYVPVGRQRHWCFVTQGRDHEGDFGVAGSCMFAFAPADWGALDAWHAGMRQVPAELRPQIPPQPTEWFAEAVRLTLNGIMVGERQLRLPLDPAEAVPVIMALVGTLPAHVTQVYSWSTCSLRRPAPDLRLVTATWPADLRAQDEASARQVDVALRRAQPVTDDEVEGRLADELLVIGYRHLVEIATRDTQPTKAAFDPALSLDEVLRELGAGGYHPVWNDVPGHLDDLAWLLEHADLVRHWAAQVPDAAIQRMQRRSMDRRVVGLFLDGLIHAQTGQRTNLLNLPTERSPELTSWRRSFAADLIQHVDPERLREIAHGWVEQNGPLYALPDREAAHDFFLSLQLDPATDPSLFPIREQFIAAGVGKGGVSSAALAELTRSPDRVTTLAHVIDLLPVPMPPRTIATLVTVAGETSPKPAEHLAALVSQLCNQLLAANMRQAEAADWLVDLLRTMHQQRLNPRWVRSCIYAVLASLDAPANETVVKRLSGLLDPAEAPAHLQQFIQRILAPAPPPQRPQQARPVASARVSPQNAEAQPPPRPTPTWAPRDLFTRSQLVNWGVAATVGALAGALITGTIMNGSDGTPTAVSTTGAAATSTPVQTPNITPSVDRVVEFLAPPPDDPQSQVEQDVAWLKEQVKTLAKEPVKAQGNEPPKEPPPLAAVVIYTYVNPEQPETKRANALQAELNKGKAFGQIGVSSLALSPDQAHPVGTMVVSVVLRR